LAESRALHRGPRLNSTRTGRVEHDGHDAAGCGGQARPPGGRAIVGLIVNAAAGRDVRRLVGAASIVPHHEKAAIVRRVIRGLHAAGERHVCYLPDGVGILATALAGLPPGLEAEPLDIVPSASAADSTAAAHRLVAGGAGAIVTLGGDGTNRAVAAASAHVPLVAISTGTNNVFPQVLEGTVAGLAAGLVAAGACDLEAVAPRAKRVEVRCGSAVETALIDAASCRDVFRGAAAVWQPDRVRAVVLSRAEPWAVGLSSIGGRLRPVAADEAAGLFLVLGPGGRTVRAVIAPGLTSDVLVRECRLLRLGEEVRLPAAGGIIALDGERELPAPEDAVARVTDAGPRVVDVRRVLAATAG
jgi:predicted polyphosphate/ATP-dependent NAD kinase